MKFHVLGRPPPTFYSWQKKKVAVLLRSCLNPPAPAGMLWHLGPGKCLARRRRPKRAPFCKSRPFQRAVPCKSNTWTCKPYESVWIDLWVLLD